MTHRLESVLIISQNTAQKLLRGARKLSKQITRFYSEFSHGWSAETHDPNRLFDAFPRLKIREGFKLAAYQLMEGGNGNGFAFAIPTHLSLPEPREHEFDLGWSMSGTPIFCSGEQGLPEWVRADIGNFLEGDSSPLSYFQASIFLRELHEMGARWHGCSWSTHKLLTSAARIPKQTWQWKHDKPEDWRPRVMLNSAGLWQVLFYTHTGLGQEQIVLHIDTFTAGYQFDTVLREIALGQGGYVF